MLTSFPPVVLYEGRQSILTTKSLEIIMANKKTPKLTKVAEGVKQALSLTTTARSAVVATYCDALDTQERSGMLLTTVCDAVYKNCKGKPLPDADRKDIVSSIGKRRKWSSESASVRAAEVNTVLKNYSALRDAIKRLTNATDACTWHQAIALSRALNKGASLATAVKDVKNGKVAGVVSPAGRVASAIFALYKASKADKRKAVVRVARILKDECNVEFRGEAGKVF
jgi:hypothetical protein